MEKVKDIPQYEKEVLLSKKDIEIIHKGLISTNPELIITGLQSDEAREKLAEAIKKEYHTITKNEPEAIDYAIREIVGTGIIEEIIQYDEDITDIKYNGENLILESNDMKKVYEGPYDISDEYIEKIIQKFTSANRSSFTPKHPIFNGQFGNLRINAVHRDFTVNGSPTMALRITRPTLPLSSENFETFAPKYVLNLAEKVMQARANLTISGETGTGKSSFQKLLISYIDFNHTMALIEGTPELHAKKMYPDKDIVSWVTKGKITQTDLIKAALRNNVRWIAVAELLGMETYELMQAVFSGHYTLSTVHAVNGRAVPKRFANMSKIGYNIDEQSFIEDARTYLDLDFHIKRVEHKGQIMRYLSEIVEFDPEGDKTVFKQRFVNGKFICETGTLSQKIKERFEEESILFDFPEEYEHEREAIPSGKILNIPVAE